MSKGLIGCGSSQHDNKLTEYNTSYTPLTSIDNILDNVNTQGISRKTPKTRQQKSHLRKCHLTYSNHDFQLNY